eukprot:scaffold199535_cov26-Tisochrysis_lutea.AAC.3
MSAFAARATGEISRGSVATCFASACSTGRLGIGERGDAVASSSVRARVVASTADADGKTLRATSSHLRGRGKRARERKDGRRHGVSSRSNGRALTARRAAKTPC